MTFKKLILLFIISLGFYSTPTLSIENDINVTLNKKIQLKLMTDENVELLFEYVLISYHMFIGYQLYKLYKEYRNDPKSTIDKIKIYKDKGIIRLTIFYSFLLALIFSSDNEFIKKQPFFVSIMSLLFTYFLQLKLEEIYDYAIHNKGHDKTVKIMSYVLGTNYKNLHSWNQNKLSNYIYPSYEAPLIHAVHSCREYTKILSQRSDCFIDMQDKHGITGLLYTILNNISESIGLFLNKNADTLIADNRDKTIHDYIEKKSKLKRKKIEAIFKKYRKPIASELQEIEELIPDLANIVSEYAL